MTREELEILWVAKEGARIAYQEYKPDGTLDGAIADRKLCRKKIEADRVFGIALEKYTEENL